MVGIAPRGAKPHDGAVKPDWFVALNIRVVCIVPGVVMTPDRFEKWGLKQGTLGIVYGMAEVTNSVFIMKKRTTIG